jgi:uncharacterized protein
MQKVTFGVWGINSSASVDCLYYIRAKKGHIEDTTEQIRPTMIALPVQICECACYTSLMKTQIVFIHGGTSFSSQDAFLEYLKTTELPDPFQTERPKKWKESIQETFGTTCDIFYPSMPNSANAHYIEWKIWFERYFEHLTGNVILIGHSQGGYFLAKYLSENIPPFPVCALYLISAPYENFDREDDGDFSFNPNNLKNIEKTTKDIVLFHSTNDDIVPFSHAERYKNALPTAKFMVFHDRGHFLDPQFPEIIEDIKKYL